MLRSFITWLFILTTTVLVAACCGSVACECEDAYADAIGFTFARTNPTDTTRQFTRASLDTVFLVRVPRDTAQRPRADIVAIARLPSVVFEQPIIITNTSPFTQAGARKLDQYDYTLYLAPRRQAAPTFTYRISKVELATSYQADGCCTCYQNTSKRVSVTDQQNVTRVLDLTDPSGNNQLVPIVVTP